MKAKIIENYILHCNRNGKMPVSIFEFCENIQITESQFYDEFSDLASIEAEILAQVWSDSLSKVSSQDYYHELSQQEKLLSVVYAFFENLKNYRSYLLLKYKDWKNPMQSIETMNALKNHFFEYLDGLKIENTEIGIPQVDKYLDKGMHHGLFTNLAFVMNFWLNDKSKGFEKTDACIEKSFALSFELISNNAIQKAFDFGKFLLAELK
jgi:hypothetical protein